MSPLPPQILAPAFLLLAAITLCGLVNAPWREVEAWMRARWPHQEPALVPAPDALAADCGLPPLSFCPLCPAYDLLDHAGLTRFPCPTHFTLYVQLYGLSRAQMEAALAPYPELVPARN